LNSEIVNEFADGQVQRAKPEQTEDDEASIILPRRGRARQDIGQRTPDEITSTGELFGKVDRRLCATDVINVINNIVAGEDDFRC
jgi:hypothetical protein